jgi:hypothetical protein
LDLQNPTGSVQVTEVFAPRLADLNGKTICELTYRMWESDRTFPALTEALKKQFPTATILEPAKLPFYGSPWAGNFEERSSVTELKNLAVAVKAAGCQAVIVGNAG